MRRANRLFRNAACGALLGLAVACSEDAPGTCPQGFVQLESDCVQLACVNVDCDGHGSCAVVGEQALCVCDAGYERGQSPTSCVAAPCAGVDCSGHGLCVDTGGAASCHCDAGYQPGEATGTCEAAPILRVVENGHLLQSGSVPYELPPIPVGESWTVNLVLRNDGAAPLQLQATEGQKVDGFHDASGIASFESTKWSPEHGVSLDLRRPDAFGQIYEGQNTTNWACNYYESPSSRPSCEITTGESYQFGYTGSCTRNLYYAPSLRTVLGGETGFQFDADVQALYVEGSAGIGYVGVSRSVTDGCWPTLDVGISVSAWTAQAKFFVNDHDQGCTFIERLGSGWRHVRIEVPDDTRRPRLFIDGQLACEAGEALASSAYDGQLVFGSHKDLITAVDNMVLLRAASLESGTMQSSNLLDGHLVDSIVDFGWTALLPDSTGLQAQFSPDGVTWFDAAGARDGWSDLTTATGSVSLAGSLSSASTFYYRLRLAADTVNQVSPVVQRVSLGYLAPLSLAQADRAFSVVSLPTAPIEPGQAATATVLFRPTSAGQREATLTIRSNDPAAPTFSVPLVGKTR